MASGYGLHGFEGRYVLLACLVVLVNAMRQAVSSGQMCRCYQFWREFQGVRLLKSLGLADACFAYG